MSLKMSCKRLAKLTGVLLFAATVGSVAASAQVDLSGEWKPIFYEDQPERVPGPELADYLGLPINDAVRMRADTWEASLLELQQWQCRPHSADYIWRGPSNATIWQDQDPLSREVTWHVYWLRNAAQDLIIHMDNPPQPSPDAKDAWFGFATGQWEGDVLTVHITHLKEGYMRRNGVARSDKANVTLHMIRHGDILTVVVIVNDPLYLKEPFIRSTDLQLDVHQHVPPYPCEMVEEVDRPAGVVPNWLPGANPNLHEFADKYHIPFDATRGGPETMYPEYRKKLKEMMNASDYDKYILQPVHAAGAPDDGGGAAPAD
jgi:hypothetical protein